MTLIPVILPTYQQPAFLSEAVESALASQDVDTRVIIVDDGCPLPETAELCATWARAWPERVIALRQEHAGVGAARNRGIEHALAQWPEAEYFFFLDGDDRLPPRTLRRLAGELAAHPQAGWAFCDLDVFGIRGYISMAGPYSALEMLFRNYSSSGSLVRRALLASGGLRFDPDPRAGYEDWDFWLQAQANGWRGHYAPHCALGYRRRGESRVREDIRRHAEIEAYLRRKHAAQYRPPALLDLEQREHPRYAIGEASTTDPTLRSSNSGATLPDYICVAPPEFLAALDGAHVTRGLFWHCETILEERGCPAVGVRAQAGDHWGLVDNGSAAGPLHMILARRTRDGGSDPAVRPVLELTLPIPVPAPTLRFPDDVPAPPPAPKVFREHSSFGRLPPAEIRRHMREACGAGVLYPVTSSRRPGHLRIGFVISCAEFGGVERVTANYARELQRAGHECHLFVLGRDRATLLPEFRDDVFAGITLVPVFSSPTPHAHPESYAGTPLTAWMMAGDQRKLLGLLCGMDVVINAHAYEAFALSGPLRRLGITTIASLHTTDRNQYGTPQGLPHLAAAYESTHDRFLVISQSLAQWCEASGIPRSKQILIRNAPSYALAPERIAEILAARGQENDDERRQGPLRALFLARFDWQKGVDRLRRLIAGAQRRGLEIEWRIVGRHLMDSQDRAELAFLQPWLHPEAATAEALTGHYAWAGVLVVPSRFEGVPLTILEAARLGCPAVAMRVGEVEEALDDGQTGLLCDSVESMLDHLAVLAGDRARLSRLAQSAAARPHHWDLGPLVDYLREARRNR